MALFEEFRIHKIRTIMFGLTGLTGLVPRTLVAFLVILKELQLLFIRCI